MYGLLIDEFIIPEEISSVVNEDEEDKEISVSYPSVKLDNCLDCGVAFASAESLEQHRCDLPEVKVSSPKPSSPNALLCLLCNDEFHLKSSLVQHLRSTHHLYPEKGSGDQPLRLADGKFKCPKCEKRFCRKLNAQQHLITHDSQKDFQCNHCSFRCYTKTQLDVHKAKHTKRHRCDLCAKMFSYKFQLETHVQAVHYNMRPFPCDICGKSFKTRYNYGSHMAQHRDVRNFQCPHCPHKCRKSYDLRVHIRTHTGEKPFQCSYCKRCYSQNGDRLKHERICLPKMKKKGYFANINVTP